VHDCIGFDTKSVDVARIKSDDGYNGVRVKFHAHLAEARVPMQVDIGFGDSFCPNIQLASFPLLLPMEAPLICAYPRETSIAEKFHAMVVLDIRNSGRKDFYDIWFCGMDGKRNSTSCTKQIVPPTCNSRLPIAVINRARFPASSAAGFALHPPPL